MKLPSNWSSGVPIRPEEDVVEILVSTFRDLRTGVTEEGIQVEQPSTIMSTAEAVSVCISAGIDAHYYSNGTIDNGSVVVISPARCLKTSWTTSKNCAITSTKW